VPAKRTSYYAKCLLCPKAFITIPSKPQKYCSKACRAVRLGELNRSVGHRAKVSASRRRILGRYERPYNYKGWKELRALAVKSMPFCLWCLRRDRLEAHHIHPSRLGGENAIENLVVLCKSCHQKTERMQDALYAAKIPIPYVTLLIRIAVSERLRGITTWK
jgi:5-methylcytosine-specific restriction endonuclease McrA